MIRVMRLRLDLPALVTALLATVLGLQVAYLVTTALRGPGAPISVPATMSEPAKNETAATVAALKNAAVFGVAGSGDPTVIKTSSSELKLSGLLAEDDATLGQAIISDASGPAQVYRVGSMLPGGSRLREVRSDHVILDRNGTLERLDLPRQTTTGGASGAARFEPAGVPSTSSLPLTNVEAGLANVIRWQTVIRGGQSPGIRVYPGADARAFSRLGLEAGDLIVAVNDSPLSDQANGDAFLRSLAGMPQASLKIERAGNTKNILVDLASIANGGAN